MKLTVTIEVEADVDGWAQASGINAATALTEILAYLRTTDPGHGQTYLTTVSTDAHFDMSL